MKVLILTGSPHCNGTTATLTNQLCLGAKEAGHQITRFETAELDIHPCKGCGTCRENNGKCVYEDDMNQIYPHLMEADIVVLVTPIYYFNMTAQLKCAVDRFYAISPQLKQMTKKFYLLAACANGDETITEALKKTFETIRNYMNWQEGSTLIVCSAANKEALNDCDLNAAREMGKNL